MLQLSEFASCCKFSRDRSGLQKLSSNNVWLGLYGLNSSSLLWQTALAKLRVGTRLQHSLREEATC